ncbi:hypothetical protein [Pedobacter frigiditerrae]|uniref:hypothetical protein n=1 Tax=Pedobacter frigiditerrae TaxID=2530452 RepID=UPI001039582D|nr:hypothetical protein [Pedobacter frigiditerrae]
MNIEFQKNIKDIYIENGNWTIVRSSFSNLVQLEQQIAKLPYNGCGLKKDEAVENTLFPPFLQVFYYLIYQHKSIPNEELYFSEYLKWLNVDPKTNGQFAYQGNMYSIEGLKARALRAYPSLIRDIHFYYFLLESKEFENVKYSMHADYYEGLDILVTRQDVTYGVSILINTKRGAAFKKLKERRHNYENNIKEIILKVDFSELHKNGNFYLLDKEQLKRLLSEIGTTKT